MPLRDTVAHGHLLSLVIFLQVSISAGIPDEDGPGPVLTLGDDALELRVAQRMVLGGYGQAFLTGVGRRPFGHGPGLQHTVDLQAKVIVKPGSVVPLNDEDRTFSRAGAFPAGWFWRLSEVPSFQVLLEGIVLCSHSDSRREWFWRPRTGRRGG